MTLAGVAGEAAVTRPARAKLNLTLRITGKRDDGYHLLNSIVVFAEYGDGLTARVGGDGGLGITGPFAASLDNEPDNLVLRAKRALASAAGVDSERVARTSLVLDKRLPVASGIGGGSADAAATLAALQTLWEVTLPPATLASLALALGADVPVCLSGAATRMRGIGEELAPLTGLPATALVLVNPLVPCPTGPVFKARSGAFSPPLDFRPPQDVAALADLVRKGGNDLEIPATTICPPIAVVLAALHSARGCLAAAMSGSGATCFGIFADDEAAQAAATRIGSNQRGWWVMPTRLAR